MEKNQNDLLSAAEAAAQFRVNRKTLARWADAGKLSVFRTLGGQRRYLRTEVTQLVSDHSSARTT